MRAIVLAIVVVLAVATVIGAQPLTGRVQTVIVAPGDTLRSLAARFGVDPVTIARDNGLPIDAKIAAGGTLSIDNRHVVPSETSGAAILVNVPQRVLFAVSPAGVAAYPVAVGRPGWPTPLGQFSIASKEKNPTWDVPESIREEARRAGRSLPLAVPPGPNNPLGAHWLGLSSGSVGIHGTNAPRSVYQVTTHGCIRLHPEDIAALFGVVQVGTTGAFVYQPVLVAVAGDDVFVEVHRDVYNRGPRDPLEFVSARIRELGAFERVDWNLVAEAVRERGGIARMVTRAAGS